MILTHLTQYNKIPISIAAPYFENSHKHKAGTKTLVHYKFNSDYKQLHNHINELISTQIQGAYPRNPPIFPHTSHNSPTQLLPRFTFPCTPSPHPHMVTLLNLLPPLTSSEIHSKKSHSQIIKIYNSLQHTP